MKRSIFVVTGAMALVSGAMPFQLTPTEKAKVGADLLTQINNSYAPRAAVEEVAEQFVERWQVFTRVFDMDGDGVCEENVFWLDSKGVVRHWEQCPNNLRPVVFHDVDEQPQTVAFRSLIPVARGEKVRDA